MTQATNTIENERPCPLCHRAPAIYLNFNLYKCRRQLGGCGKIFKGAMFNGELKTEKEVVKQKKTTAEITCVNCGIKRIVLVQDVFQVKRCIPCQKKFRSQRKPQNEPTGGI